MAEDPEEAEDIEEQVNPDTHEDDDEDDTTEVQH